MGFLGQGAQYKIGQDDSKQCRSIISKTNERNIN